MISGVKRLCFISVRLQPARAISARWREVTINQKLASTFRLGPFPVPANCESLPLKKADSYRARNACVVRANAVA